MRLPPCAHRPRRIIHQKGNALETGAFPEHFAQGTCAESVEKGRPCAHLSCSDIRAPMRRTHDPSIRRGSGHLRGTRTALRLGARQVIMREECTGILLRRYGQIAWHVPPMGPGRSLRSGLHPDLADMLDAITRANGWIITRMGPHAHSTHGHRSRALVTAGPVQPHRTALGEVLGKLAMHRRGRQRPHSRPLRPVGIPVGVGNIAGVATASPSAVRRAVLVCLGPSRWSIRRDRDRDALSRA